MQLSYLVASLYREHILKIRNPSRKIRRVEYRGQVDISRSSEYRVDVVPKNAKIK